MAGSIEQPAPTVLVASLLSCKNAKLPISSPVIAVTIANTQLPYPRRDGQAELA